MLRSRLLYLPRKNVSAEAVTASHQLLVRASFFRPGHGAGLWETLPLGKRVLDKLQSIIVEEMNSLDGCQQMEMPSLMTSDTWRKTGRWESIGEEMFRLKDRKETDLLLAPTHEEAFTSSVAQMYGIVPKSALPVLLYQIGRKFRDELRPRAGLLRAREFIMKDLYAFDESEQKALVTYNNVCSSYARIFRDRLQCPIVKAQADSGNMGGNYSHEFHFVSEVGEDIVVMCKSGTFCANVEVSSLRTGDTCTDPKCSCGGKGVIEEKKCIEIGHAFYLGTKYTLPLAARCMPEGESKPKTLAMGSYGLGVTRIIAAIVETSHDQDGIIWPEAIAPFKVVLIPAPGASQARVDEAFKFFKAKIGSDALLDDRPESTSLSSKILDAKLMGVPKVCVVRKNSELEIIDRKTGSASVFKSLEEVLQVFAR